jgi:hypothetical protein
MMHDGAGREDAREKFSLGRLHYSDIPSLYHHPIAEAGLCLVLFFSHLDDPFRSMGPSIVIQ